MLTVQQAENIILDHKMPLNTEGVFLKKSIGRILQEDLFADRDFPPFDRVTMDGIAIHFDSFKNGQRVFNIQNTQAAGMPPLILSNKQECIEVMTGAVLPIGTDTVIRYEDLTVAANLFADTPTTNKFAATVLIENIDFQQNIHKKGIDRKLNDLIIGGRVKITAAEIGTAATIGKTHLQVAKLPKVAIISTGDELVAVGETPLPHQIRRSNVYAIAAILETEFKIKSKLFHFKDDKNLIVRGLKKILNQYDIVVLSGAVSEGKFDFVPTALEDLGVEKLFHKVAQRPGKPFWFGKYQNQSVIFALPGNPVSTFLCAYRYLVPFVACSLGIKIVEASAVLLENVVFKPNLTYFMPVSVQSRTLGTEGGVLKAKPLAGHGSGDLANLNDADGFLELPQERTLFQAGEAFPLIQYRK